MSKNTDKKVTRKEHKLTARQIDGIDEVKKFEREIMYNTDLEDMGSGKKMDLVMQGLKLGLDLQTSLSLCMVDLEYFRKWLQVPINQMQLRRSQAISNAELQLIVHQSGKQNPYIAQSELEKRSKQTEVLELPNSGGGEYKISDTLQHKSEVKSANYMDAEEILS